MPNPSQPVKKLIIRNVLNHSIGQSLRVYVRDGDLEMIEPALQRIMRNGLNPGFKFEVQDEVRVE